jgi:adenylate cyclase class 2
MQSAEIELKFPIDDLTDLQSRLPGLGFHLDTPRTFEQNTLYDTPTRTLRQSKQILRLRRYGDLWTLTHKRQTKSSVASNPGGYTAESKYKVRVETETHVDDGPALGLIFEALGYAPVFRYEKFRTEWSQHAADTPSTISGPLFPSPILASVELPEGLSTLSSGGHLVLDETPIGNYAELEGLPAWIDMTLAALGIDPAICITDSYGRLFLDWKQRTGSPAENLTFDEIPVPISEPELLTALP